MLGVTTELFCPQFPHQPGHQTRWFLSKTETDTDWHWKYSQYWTQLALGAGIYSAEDIQTPGPKGQEIKQTVKEDFSRFTAWELKTNLCEIKSLIIIEKDPMGPSLSQWLWNFNLRKGSFRALYFISCIQNEYINYVETFSEWKFTTKHWTSKPSPSQHSIMWVYTLVWRSVDECTWHVFSSKDWWELAVELWVCT